MKSPVVLLALTLMLLWAPLVSAAEPRFEIEVSDYDFGTVFEGEKVARTFRFRNAGQAPLTIDRVRSSCGCTVPRLSAEVIAPGDVAEIEAVFDTARFRGRQVKTIYLHTNDPRQEVVQLTMQGVVAQLIETDPARIDFGVIRSGEVKEASVSLHNRGKEAVSLGAVNLSHPDLKAVLGAGQLAPGASTILRVTAVPTQERGRLSGYVIIPTSHPGVPELRLPVFGTVTP